MRFVETSSAENADVESCVHASMSQPQLQLRAANRSWEMIPRLALVPVVVDPTSADEDLAREEREKQANSRLAVKPVSNPKANKGDRPEHRLRQHSRSLLGA